MFKNRHFKLRTLFNLHNKKVILMSIVIVENNKKMTEKEKGKTNIIFKSRKDW